MNVVFVSSEVAPFARTGGLGDVSGSLPKGLQKLGYRVSVFMPFYRHVRCNGFEPPHIGEKLTVPVDGKPADFLVRFAHLPGTTVPVYFIDNDAYFNREELYADPSTGKDYVDNCARFSFFSQAVLEAVKSIGIRPDVVHCNDWQSAMIPVYLKSIYKDINCFTNTLTVLTIHNLAYQGLFPAKDLEVAGLDKRYFNSGQLEYYGKINLLKGGLVFADIITTVSKRYSEEIQTEEFGAGLNGVLKERSKDLYGIVNGIDYSVWNPEDDGLIPATYAGLPHKMDVPLIGMITRLAEQKGIDLLSECWDKLMELDISLFLLGSGDKRYQDALSSLANKYPHKAHVHVGFDNRLSHEIEAGADMFLMPSRFEPCGLNQLYSLKYGTVPIVHKTGGLADTVTPSVGFLFESYTSEEMLKAVREAVEAYRDREKWLGLMRAGMLRDWSWDKSARRYADVYQDAFERVRR
jgi:starch synthase